MAPDESANAVASALRPEPIVLYAEPNYVYHLDATPNDPFFGNLWGLQAIQAPNAWDTTTGSSAVKVAVVDSGIAYDHLDLGANVWTNPGESGAGKDTNGVDDDHDGFVDDVRGWDFVQNDNEPLDFNGHGTHVAGTIGAVGNNGIGVAGVNWHVSLIPLRAADTYGELTDADIVKAFSYACARGARVVNASFGGPGFSQAMLDVINSPACRNTLFVAAAGNEGVNVDTSPSYPCSYSAANVVCVAASDQSNDLDPFSNYGAGSVDLAAPGVDVLSTVPDFEDLFSEDFEADISSTWTVGGTTLQWAPEALLGGGFALSDSPGNYGANEDSWIRRVSAVSLAGRRGCALEYDLELDTQADHDRLFVEGSTDGSSWTSVDSLSGSTGGSFAAQLSDLSSFDGASTFYLRFRLQSDGDATVGDGALIDNVFLSCLGTTFTDAYASLSETSMAAAHVSGAAALIFAAAPATTTGDAKADLLLSVIPDSSLNGKTVSRGLSSAAGALQIAKSPLPDTAFRATPPRRTRWTGADFEFAGGVYSVEWSLDGGPWTTAEGLSAHLIVGEGTHILRARSRDQWGRTDPTPASWTWTVDLTGPRVILTSGPKTGVTVRSSTVTFTFASDDPGASYECGLDTGVTIVPIGLLPCTSPVTYTRLSGGWHSFSLAAADDVGNIGQPIQTVWLVRIVRCVVPRVKGKRLTTARRAIVRAHCAVGKITRAYSARVRKGRVISQKPAARKRLPKGAKVRLVVSRGARRR